MTKHENDMHASTGMPLCAVALWLLMASYLPQMLSALLVSTNNIEATSSSSTQHLCRSDIIIEDILLQYFFAVTAQVK